jgi:hypothetical protein
VHVAPACVGSGGGSDHFGSYVRSIFLHFYKKIFLTRQQIYHCARDPLALMENKINVESDEDKQTKKKDRLYFYTIKKMHLPTSLLSNYLNEVVWEF